MHKNCYNTISISFFFTMVKYCVAPGCHNTQKSKDIHFHRLPIKRPKLLKRWLHNMKLKDPSINENSRICSAHFLSNCYLKDFKSELMGLKSSTRLKEAVPTIFDFSRYDKVTDVPSLSAATSAAENTSRFERLQRRSWNREIEKVRSIAFV